MIGIFRNIGIAIGGITLIILLIKMSTDPDNKGKYIKLIKNTIIASILITLSLTLLQIPKDFFGEAVGIADDTTGDVTFAKIEDKDCQGRETVNIDGKRYVVTDTGKKIAALTDTESLRDAFGIYSSGKVVENVCYLRPFNDCKDFGKVIMQILNIIEIQMDLYFHHLLHILNIYHIKDKVVDLLIIVGGSRWF